MCIRDRSRAFRACSSKCLSILAPTGLAQNLHSPNTARPSSAPSPTTSSSTSVSYTHLDFDGESLAAAQERMGQLMGLMRSFGPTMEAVFELSLIHI